MSGVKLFYQPCYNLKRGRMRMIWPDGRSQWVPDYYACFYDDWRQPCWSYSIKFTVDGYHGTQITQKAAIQAMRRYDESRGFPKAWYLGEI